LRRKRPVEHEDVIVMPVQHCPLARLEAGGIVSAVSRNVVLDGVEGHVVVDVVSSQDVVTDATYEVDNQSGSGATTVGEVISG
jgi:hypothetical protein